MRIVSWNTFLAPTMSGRINREPLIINQIIEWMSDDIDIIALQEMNDFTLGIFGFIYYKLHLHVYCYDIIHRILEFMFIIEGWILPLFLQDNSYKLKQQVDQFNNEKIHHIILLNHNIPEV